MVEGEVLGRTRLVAAPDAEAVLREWLAAHRTLFDAAAVRPGAHLLQGRGPVVVAPAAAGDGQWVVRHYHRGGAIARALGDRYLRVGLPRPLRELRITQAAEARGIPVPSPVAAAVYPRGAFYTGDLVTEYIPDTADLPSILFPADPGHTATSDGTVVDPAAAMGAAGSVVRTLHDGGVIHPDLNLKNILVRPSTSGLQAFVIDLDRARLVGRVGALARARMLRRFWRSAAKWERARGRPLPDGARRAFEEAYAAGPR